MAKKIKYMGVTSTQELINLIKADFAKKQDILQFVEMPPAAQHVGRVFEYVGETDRRFVKGHFYKSTGFDWLEVYESLGGKTWEYVDVLPSYDDANFVTIYVVPDLATKSFTAYIKSEVPNEFLTLTEVLKVTCYDDQGTLVENDVAVTDAHFIAVTDEEIVHFMRTV